MTTREQEMDKGRRNDGLVPYLWWLVGVGVMILGGLGLLRGLSILSMSGIIAVVAGALLIGIFTLPARTKQERL
jgi:hypothetical protein